MTIPATVSGAMMVQYYDGADWVNFGRGNDLGSILRTRRSGRLPGQSITAQQWRIIKTGTEDWGTNVVRIDQIAFWAENAALEDGEVAEVRLKAFNFDDDSQRYILPITDGCVDVWRQSQFMTPIPAPYGGDEISLVMDTQQLDTMIGFHQDVAPLRIMRQGSHTEWDSRPLAFDSLPLYDYDGTHAGGVDEVQQLFFDSYHNGDTFNVTFEAQVTNALAYSSVSATMAATLQAGLEALPNIGAGNVAVANVATDTYTITFQGTLASADVGTMAPVTLVSTAGGVSVAVLTEGKPGGEAIISAARGWPATGVFYEQRLYMAGLKGRPETFLGSQEGSYFALDTAGADDAGALNENLDTDQVTAIRSIFSGRHLQIFSNSAEFYFPADVITPPTPVKRATRRGVAAGTPQFSMDLATMFIGVNGNALYSYEFDYFKDNYSATNVSAMASHIVSGVIDAGYRKHLSTSDPDLAVMPRGDGTAAVMVAMVDQNITGFVPWTTNGSFLAATAEMGGDIYLATARKLGDGSTVRFLERLDATRLLDCSVAAAFGDAAIDTAAKTFAVGDDFEGMIFTLYIDGADAGDVAVTGGLVALPRLPLRTIEAGLLFQPKLTTLPMVFQNDPRGGVSMQPKVGNIELRLGPTANLRGGIVGGKTYRFPLKRRPDALLDQGPGEDAFTGWTRLWGVPGFRPDAQVFLVQERPGPLNIQEIVATATS